MLSHRDLTQLAATYMDRHVLTVYLRATVENPADRNRWHAELAQTLHALREREAGASHSDRAALDDAVATLREWLLAQKGTLRAPGVLVIVAPGEVLFSTPIDTAVPNVATWKMGIHVAPLLKAVSLGASAAVLVLDARHAHLYRFTPPRHVERVESMTADIDFDVEHHLGGGNATFHQGTRGGTAADEIDRQHMVARDRLYADVMVRAVELAGRDGWLCLAGNARAVAAARAVVPHALDARTLMLEGLDMHSTPYAIAREVAKVTQARAEQMDTELVRGIIDEHGSRGRAVTGIRATKAMLDREGVADLILSERFVELFPVDTDDMVRHAFHQGALVREVHGAAAEEIDQRAEGVVARLRYAVAAGSA
ncbi:MAG: hypothetical protein IPJ56_09580 [Gemmatimonadetes bacterium]|nr:hypothetical protein [Gemmatimonadota bacterium]MBK7832570.1 hypothetical protein [Gemmatimonadota bacterium]